MNKHTPGPWRISGYNDNMGYPEPVIAGMVSGCTAYVAVCIDCAGMTDANARLIAAAPDLLEALDEAVKDLVAAQFNARTAARADKAWSGVSEAIQPSVDKARAAIAKARGES